MIHRGNLLQISHSFKIILGSSSKYRKELLDRILDKYSIECPNVDEKNMNNKNAKEHSKDLALLKVDHVAKNQKNALIISADQIGVIDNNLLEKPLNKQDALEQLLSYSNKTAHFFTSSVILDSKNCKYYKHTEKTTIHFGKISAAMANAYIEHDDPLDCAGSFKAECGGVILFKSIETNDPTALIGLPLIWVSLILKKLNVLIN